MKRHYIYRLEHIETKEFYWGVRTCKCEPIDDPYMGSMSTWKVDKTQLIKRCLKRNIYFNGEFVYCSIGDFKEFCINNKIYMEGLCIAYKKGLPYKGYTVEIIKH